MKNLFAFFVLGTALSISPSFAKEKPAKHEKEEKEEKPTKACMKAADKSIAESRDSDATFEHVDGDTYVYGVSRGHEDSCFYDINVKVKKHNDGTCTAEKAEFDGSSANCG